MSNWQPIETLRMHGEPVLMRLPDGTVTTGEALCMEGEWYYYLDCLVFAYVEPTHWQPFPSGDLDCKAAIKNRPSITDALHRAILRIARDDIPDPGAVWDFPGFSRLAADLILTLIATGEIEVSGGSND